MVASKGKNEKKKMNRFDDYYTQIPWGWITIVATCILSNGVNSNGHDCGKMDE